MSISPEVSISAFRVDDRGPVTVEVQAGEPLRGASVVKPLLMWVAVDIGGFARDRHAWETLARAAITTSDNAATAAVWSQAGAHQLLATLHQRAGGRRRAVTTASTFRWRFRSRKHVQVAVMAATGAT